MSLRVGCAYLAEVVVHVKCVQVGQVPIQPQSHQETCILVGQFIVFGSVVDNPR